MTKTQFHKLLDQWVEVFGLTHWRWEVILGCPDLEEDWGAAADIHDHYDQCRLRFNERWKTWDRDEASRNIAHELAHVAVRDMRVAFDAALAAGRPSGDAQIALRLAWEHAEEGAVERLADSMVSLAQQ